LCVPSSITAFSGMRTRGETDRGLLWQHEILLHKNTGFSTVAWVTTRYSARLHWTPANV
jgi:hypothetical protein